jgi:hypothetical protein
VKPRFGLAFAVVAAALAACGSQAPPRAVDVLDRQWVANTTGVVEQLRRDVTLTQVTGQTLATAGGALRDDSALYVLLLAYSDFGGCDRMVGQAGDAPPSTPQLQRTLSATCRRLQAAAKLFTRATKNDDAHALLAASREASAASPLLVRARLQLAAAQGHVRPTG